MPEVNCPRCVQEFREGTRDEDAIGLLEYAVSGGEVEPVSECEHGHSLTTPEWDAADRRAQLEAADARGQYDGPDTRAEQYDRK